MPITDDHFNEIDALLKACVENEDLLTDWENGFVSEWCDKLDAYQTNVRITDKQSAIFDRLQAKMSNAGLL